MKATTGRAAEKEMSRMERAMKASDGMPIKKASKNDMPDKKPPSSKIGADKSPYAAESSKRPYSSAAR